jgi:hypothetical protein
VAFANLVAERVDALQIGVDPFLVARTQQIVTLAARHGVRAI